MPALKPVPNVLRVRLIHTYGSDADVIAHLYFRYSGSAPSSSALATMAATVGTAWGSDLKGMASGSITLTGVEITDLTSSTSGQGAATASIDGTRSGTGNGAGVAVLVNFKIARRYRGGKPRLYLPYFTNTDLNSVQQWKSASVTALNTALAAFIADVTAAAPGGTTITDQVNVSYYTGNVVAIDPVTGRARNVPQQRTNPLVDVVTSLATAETVSSQRRRNRK